jgi:hypothetical protein
MTLILWCVTPDFVYQVSDRRLIWADGRVEDDERNKAVLVDGRFAFGYTGLAEIGGVKTDEWLARVAADGPTHDMSAILTRIRDRATEAFRSINIFPEYKGHAFQGVGWVFDRGFPGGVPAVLTTGNVLDSDHNWLPAANDVFDSRYRFFDGLTNGFEVGSVGQGIAQDHKEDVLHRIEQLARRAAPPGEMLGALVDGVRYLAEWYRSIGHSLMAISIPRSAALRFVQSGRMAALSSGPLESHTTFLYVSSDNRTESYGPHFATPGAAMTNFRTAPLSPPEPEIE